MVGPRLGPCGSCSPLNHQVSGACLLPFDPTGPECHVEVAVVGITVSTSHSQGGGVPQELQKLADRSGGTWRTGGPRRDLPPPFPVSGLSLLVCIPPGSLKGEHRKNLWGRRHCSKRRTSRKNKANSG